MTDAQMKQLAVDQVTLHSEADCNPVITAEVYGIVTRRRRAKVHAVSTAYVYGDVMQLATRNGHRYRCIEGGTSDSTEPDFSTARGAQITDGTVTWLEEGEDYENVYDIRGAIHECWMLKASKSSHLVTTSQGHARVEASNLQQQCRQRAMDYAPLVFA